VKRLAGSDAGFLFIESPTQTSVCVDVVEIGLAADGRGPLQLHELRDHLASRLDRVEPFRWRLERVPLGLAHPIWIEDPDFDLGYHVREVTVDAPGSDADLDRLIAGQLGGLLDLRHPLWQVVLVHGLAGGRQAILFRVHHATADGEALVSTVNALFDDGEEAPLRTGASETDRLRPPGRVALVIDALRTQLKALIGLPALLVLTMRRFRSVEERRKAAPVQVPRFANDAPPTILNNSASADRTYARTRLSLADLRDVKNAAGTTLPDVILAVVSGALRRYLTMADALPDQSLVVNVPMARDFDGSSSRVTGNIFTNYYAQLGTDIADPRARLAAISAATEESKVQLDLQGHDTLPRWLDRIPPAIAEPAARAMARRSRDGTKAPDFNVLVSNMRVPDRRWSIGTRPVTRLTMSGPIADGAGLNITLTGWDPYMDVAINANPAAVERPQELAALIQGSLAELVGAFDLRAVHEPPTTGAVTSASSER